MESCRINVDALGAVTATIHTTSSGQGHETLASTVIGEALETRSRRHPHRAAGLAVEPARQFAGRQPHGDHARRRGASMPRNKLNDKLHRHRRACSFGCADGRGGLCGRRRSRAAPRAKSSRWMDLVTIAHRNFHLLPEGIGAGARSLARLSGADRRRTADARRARPDVSVPLVRVPRGADGHRSRSPARWT